MPWLFLRGNHETCDRSPGGWFRLLDPRPYQAPCQPFTEPYVAVVRGLSLAVIDSAAAADTTVSPDGQTQYARQFALLAQMAPAGSWLVTHRQVWGILAGPEGEFEVENATYQAATVGALQADYALIVSGHIHLGETIAFAATADRPPQFVSGNAGTTLEDMPTASPTGRQLGDPAVVEAETVASCGFLTFEPLGDDWIATQRDAAGDPLLWCVLDAPDMGCTPAKPPA